MKKIVDYDPKVNKFPYPKDTSMHYLKKDCVINLDLNEKYQYIDESIKFKRKLKFFRFIVRLIVFPLVKIRLNLKIVGRKNLKLYKDVLKDGAITVCNHVHMWDYLAISKALKKTDIKFLAWKKNLEASNRGLVKLAGGIPIPEDNIKGSLKFVKEINNYLNNKGWLHIYAEGSMWEFYRPIRPFKDGFAYFSIKNNKPILPLAISYRKNGFIRSKIFKSPASLTINIGKPIIPLKNQNYKEYKDEFMKLIHKEVVSLAFIKDNYYEPIYNNSKRIDYYTDSYGIGYKKSF